MTPILVIVLLTPVSWAPPGVDRAEWRAALAEDVVDLLAPLPQVETAIAAVDADLPLAGSIAWPSMKVYEVPHASLRTALQAAADDGHERAAVDRGGRPRPAGDAGRQAHPARVDP